MTESTALNPRLQGEVAIIAKAWKDDAFKQSLLADPKGTIEKELGSPLPADINLQVVEAKPDVLYVRLPEKPDSADSASLESLTASLADSEGPAIAQLIAKTWKDDAFKQAFLSNPKATLAQEFSTPLPDSLSVQVISEDDQNLVLVLPVKPDTAVELSDAELEAVSGGITPLAMLIFPFAFATPAAASAATAATVATGVGIGVSVAASAAGAAAGANAMVKKFW
ncbi:MAG: NHLP leader peptide family natural product precursor [Leptolyngbyaceae cyanobacterium CSU_1_4]|nr:NHLP leader peptide family natural product precursor [Leptolyngbyaceae cyanobacterium CSU_1_4]